MKSALEMILLLQDCSELEKQSFLCPNKEYKDYSKFSYLECENLGSLDSLGNPLLCLHDQNSPYLGDFYEKDENFSAYSFSEILAARNKEISGFKIINSLDSINKNKYKYGSNIFLLDIEGQYHSINIFSNMLSKGNGYCSKIPLRFLIDETSSCFFAMDEEQCLLNEEFHLQHHLNILKNLEFLGDINDVNISYNVVCLKDETGFITFHQNIFHRMTNKSVPFSDIIECESYPITEVNENKTSCKNVVVGFNYTISVNGTVLSSLKVTVLTVNIPLNLKVHDLLDKGMRNPLYTPKRNVIFILQKTSVRFEDSDFVGNKHGYVLGKPVYLR